ncbi:MAG: TonB-dependent receptor [Flavobacteriales bacterium]|nr:TonB-dependent receptor [Flavobacteriales bacterium]
MKIFIGCFFVLAGMIANAQTITVVDEFDEAIENAMVKIYNKEAHEFSIFFTDEFGIVTLPKLNIIDSVLVSHVSYRQISWGLDQLKKQRFRIMLESNNHFLSTSFVRHNPDFEGQKNQTNRQIKISSKNVQFLNPQTSADLVGLSNQIFIQKSQMGGGSPMFRGFAANNVLIVVDGVRMNNAIFRDGNLQNIINLDPNFVQSTEVLFGPGSVLYGSDAMGGVMVFETKNPRLDSISHYNGNVMLRTQSANKENSWHVDMGYGKTNFAGITSISIYNFGELKMGANGPKEYTRPIYTEYTGLNDTIIKNEDPNVQLFTGYSQFNFNQKFRYKFNKRNDLIVHFGHTTSSDVPRYDRLTQQSKGLPKYGDWHYGPQKWTQLNARHTLLFDKKKLADRMVATLAFQNFGESRVERAFQSKIIYENVEKVRVYSANIDFDKKKGKTDLIYGIESVSNFVQSFGSISSIDSGYMSANVSRYPNSSTLQTMAGYASAKTKLSSKMMASAGIRYSYINLYAPFTDTFYSFPFSEIRLKKSAFSGSLGVRFLANASTYVFANIASGFKAPNIDDMGKIFDNQPNRVTIPNPNLKPEYSYNYEMGLFTNLGGKVQWMINGYYTLVDNLIVRDDFSLNGVDSLLFNGSMLRTQSLVNSSRGFIHGIETQIQWSINSFFELKSNFNYISGKTSDNMSIRHVTPNFGNTSLNYKKNKIMISAYANYNTELAFEKLAPTEQGKAYLYARDANGNPYAPAWCTLNLKTSFKINKSLKANIGLENIMNKRYRPYSSGITAPGRNLVLSVYSVF